jgi:hypothetical protein
MGVAEVLLAWRWQRAVGAAGRPVGRRSKSRQYAGFAHRKTSPASTIIS